MTERSSMARHYDEAERLVEAYRAELARHGVHIAPELRVVRGGSALVYYDLDDELVHVSLPEPTDPLGRLQLAIFRPMLACETDEELAELIWLLLPRLIAHELGHHVRHRYGRFGSDLWHEEQVANQFAAAATRTHWTGPERARLGFLLRRALAALQPKVGGSTLATDTYHAPLEALGARGDLARHTVRTLDLLGQVFDVSPESLLLGESGTNAELIARFDQRAPAIQQFNDSYTLDLTRYVYLQFGWTLIDLESGVHRYFDELAREHLGLTPPMLALDRGVRSATEKQVIASYAAHRVTIDVRPTASRYFFKRYRAQLLELASTPAPTNQGDALDAPPPSIPSSLPARDGTRRFTGEARRLLEMQDEEDPGALRFASRLAPQRLQPLFPAHIDEYIEGHPETPEPEAEVDRRLLAEALAPGGDAEASGLLSLLEDLDHVRLFRALPADTLAELAPVVCTVVFAPGDVVIREGANNDDLFVLVEGELEVTVGEDSPRAVGRVLPYEVLGDMAFLTGAPRSATVTARSASRCLLVPGTTLRALAVSHPVVLLQLGRTAAERLGTLIS